MYCILFGEHGHESLHLGRQSVRKHWQVSEGQRGSEVPSRLLSSSKPRNASSAAAGGNGHIRASTAQEGPEGAKHLSGGSQGNSLLSECQRRSLLADSAWFPVAVLSSCSLPIHTCIPFHMKPKAGCLDFRRPG